jgi:hypothetical protein
MANKKFGDFVVGLPAATSVERDSINYSRTAGGISEKTTGEQTFELVNPDNTVLVKDLDNDIGPAVGGFRDLADNTHYILGKAISDPLNIWRAPTNWVGKISADSPVNSLTIKGLLIDDQFDVEIDDLQIFGDGTGVGIQSTGTNLLTSRMRITKTNISNFATSVLLNDGFYTMEGCEFNDFTSAAVDADNCSIDLINSTTLNSVAQPGATHFKFGVSNGTGQEIFALRGCNFVAATGENVFDIDPATPNLGLIEGCFTRGLAGATPTIYKTDYTDQIVSIANIGGRPVLTMGSATGLVAGDWVWLEGDVFYQGSYEIFAASGKKIALDTTFNADTNANFAFVNNGSLTNNSRMVKITGGDLQTSLALGSNRLTAQADSGVGSPGVYGNMSGTFYGADPAEGTNCMFRARTNGILQFAGRDGTRVHGVLSGAARAVGGSGEDVSNGVFLNGSPNIIADSKSALVSGAGEIGYSTPFIVELNFGDQLRPASSNQSGTNPVRNDQWTKITAIAAE